MSKKSRKRNRKILGLLAAGLGAAALAKRGTAQGVSGSDKAKFTSDAAYTAPVTGTSYPGANKAVVADPAPVDTVYGGGIHRGKPPKGDIVKRMRINAINTAEGPPSIANPYRAPRVHNRFNRGVNVSYAKGGRVKGCGIAKRGLGRAMKKGRK
jgi:hypothetical protein